MALNLSLDPDSWLQPKFRSKPTQSETSDESHTNILIHLKYFYTYNFLSGFFPWNEWNQNLKSKLSVKSGKCFIHLQTLTVLPPIWILCQIRNKTSVFQAVQDLNTPMSLKGKENKGKPKIITKTPTSLNSFQCVRRVAAYLLIEQD